MSQSDNPFIHFPANPFPGREMEAAAEREKANAVERTHIANLMSSESGLWILRRLIRSFEVILQQGASEYNRGMQDTMKVYRDLVIKHFGHSGIDKILGGK